jgi:hypothetical protein
VFDRGRGVCEAVCIRYQETGSMKCRFVQEDVLRKPWRW